MSMFVTISVSTGSPAPLLAGAFAGKVMTKFCSRIHYVVYCSRWFRWYGHVHRATSCINLLQTFRIPALEYNEGLERCGLNVRRLMSVSVAWLALTPVTNMHGEPVFDIAWCCQPDGMGHGQHLNQKWIWMDGWIDGLLINPGLRHYDSSRSWCHIGTRQSAITMLTGLWIYCHICHILWHRYHTIKQTLSDRGREVDSAFVIGRFGSSKC